MAKKMLNKPLVDYIENEAKKTGYARFTPMQEDLIKLRSENEVLREEITRLTNKLSTYQYINDIKAEEAESINKTNKNHS